jgi:hypothetical protein
MALVGGDPCCRWGRAVRKKGSAGEVGEREEKGVGIVAAGSTDTAKTTLSLGQISNSRTTQFLGRREYNVLYNIFIYLIKIKNI